MRLSPFLLSSLLRSVSGGSVGDGGGSSRSGGANPLSPGGQASARKARRLDDGIGSELTFHLAQHSVKFEGCRANRFPAEEEREDEFEEEDPWTSWVAAQAAGSSAAANSTSAGGGGRTLEQYEPTSRGTVAFRLCDKHGGLGGNGNHGNFNFNNAGTGNSPSSDACDDCVSDHGSVEIDMEAYLRYMVEWQYERQGTYCEECYECTGGGNFNNDDNDDNSNNYHPEIPCHLIDSRTCYDECQMIENMEENGYLDAAEFIECTPLEAPMGGGEVFAAAVCDESMGKIKIGVFVDEQCMAHDETKDVEDYLPAGEGFAFKLSHALLKKTYDTSGCVAECFDEDRADGLDVPVVERVCEDLWYASSLGHWDPAFDPHQQGPYTPAPTSPPCIYQNSTGTWFAGLDCEYEATSVCEDQPPDSAIPNFCTNDGSCLPHDFFVSGQFCDCPPGFWGERCELAEYWGEEDEEPWGGAWDHDHDHDLEGEESWGWGEDNGIDDGDYFDGAPNCPQVNCTTTNGGMEAYIFLVRLDCMRDCTSSKCRENFFLLRGVHDLCDHDMLPAAAEEGLHDMEEACWMHDCNHAHQGGHVWWDEVEGAPDCDVTYCDTNSGTDAYSALEEMECMVDCTSSKCGEYFLRLRGAVDLCDPGMLPGVVIDGFHDLDVVCKMHTCNYADHGWQGGWEQGNAESPSTVTEVVIVEGNDQDWHNSFWTDEDVLLDYMARDRRALEIFYRLGKGYGWMHSEGWTSGQSICEWHGVTCDVGLSVTSLELSGNFISASIRDLYGAALRQLANLTHLDLSGNQISGKIPEGFGTNLPHLEGLWLGNNQLAGSVPNSLSELSKLQTLELQENSFSWIMMNNGYTSLERLDLSDNQLSGTVQYDLARLSKLEYVSLRGNSFSGGLARDYSLLTDLTMFDISQNKITGLLPYNGFAANSELRHLNLSKNYLRGTINGDILDSAMEPNDGMYELHLSFNQLSGTVPNFDVDMLNINVAGNMLTGIDPMACDHELWNDGAVGAYMCYGILCRSGTANSVGRQTSADNPCVQCDETSYYGAIGCFEEEEEFYDDDVVYVGPDDFIGDDASDDELDCPLYCQNGGSCRVNFSQFRAHYWCSCPRGYTGALCESMTNFGPSPGSPGGLQTDSFVQVVSPVRLAKEEGYDHQVALFGPPSFAGRANVFYAGSQLCDEIDYVDEWKAPFILLVDRGQCTFVLKVRHAQWINAEAVIIADNTCLCEEGDACTSDPGEDCEERRPILADDGSASDIYIPSFLIFKQDASLIKEELISGNEVVMELTMSQIQGPTTRPPLYQPTPPPSMPYSLARPTPPPLALSASEEEEQSAVVVSLDIEQTSNSSSSAQPSIALSTSPSLTPSAAPTEMSSISQEPTTAATDPEPDFISSPGEKFSLRWLFMATTILFSGVAI